MAAAREVRPASGAMANGDRMDVPLVRTGSGQEVQRVAYEAEAGCWNTMTFGWLSELIAEGYRREMRRERLAAEAARAGGEAACAPLESSEPTILTEADLCELRPDDLPQRISQSIDEHWMHEVNQHPEGARSLRRAMRIAFGGPFFVAAGFKFVYDSLQMVGPYTLKELLAYLKTCDVDCELSTGLNWVAVILASNLIQTACLHQYFHRCFRTGMRLNAAAINLVYKKSLKIASPGKAAESSAAGGAGNAGRQQQQQGQQPQWSTGKIVNLMSTDAQRLQEMCTYLNTLWSGPYQIIITLIFLYYVVSWATFAGLGVMLLQVPLVGMISRKVKKAQNELMKSKDERIKVTNEIFGSVKLLKMYGWEEAFERRLTEIRNGELRQLRKYQMLNIISSAMWMISPILTSIMTFATYTAMGYALEAKTAFAAMSLFNVLRFPLTMFPNTISSAVEANVAIKRIEDFLDSPEIDGRRMPSPDEHALQTGVAICLKDATYEWPNGSPLISGVSFAIPAPTPGQERAHLTVIFGSVGAGKSGLLQAIIGDLSPKSGRESVYIRGRIAYSSQVAWIRNATVRDNIVFNSRFDEQRYNEVVRACQLTPDLEALPNGDATEIGEKGVNLSGGQRQRVSLARAVYANAALLLLDDPLSAVDSEVAKKLLKMFRGPLVKNCSIVLCTHNLGALHQADQVILLEREGASTAAAADGGEGGAGTPPTAATTNARVTFCGSPEDFGIKYPERARKVERSFSRQESEEDAPSAAPSTGGAGRNGRLTTAEAEAQGSVSWKVYKTYMDAAGGAGFAAAVLGGLVFGQACQTATDTWVSFWSDHSKDEGKGHVYISSAEGIMGYCIASLAAFFGIIATSAMFRTTALRAARAFHERLLDAMLKLPMTFYDTTPLGRVLNRFSKDIYTVDEVLVSILMMYFNTLCRVFATIVVIAAATPWFLVIIIPLLFIYRHTQNYYVPTSRQLKRIESNLRSPIFSHFDETLQGVASIRAFGQQAEFIDETLDKIQRNMRGYYVSVASNRWLAVRLETLGTVIVTAASILAVLDRVQISAGVAGLSISYALGVTQALNWVVRMTSDRETNIVSVERLSDYISQAQEPPRHAAADPAANAWPTAGRIEFQGVRLRYRPGLPLVLDGLDLVVSSGEKLGICGRTGAGKSSMLNILLRIVDPEGGRVMIDGMDIHTLGLHRLRRSITVLPQDPVLFSGSLRFNLDPLGDCSNDAMWKALDRSHLTTHIRALEAQANAAAQQNAGGNSSPGQTLDTVKVAEGGENFSVGQRQQMCLARALLRSNKILLLDEATSAVDIETDSKIQQTLQTEFVHHTVLCIAHRISTVLHYDRACVVDAGKVAELGPPKELLKQEGSRFKRLADHDRSR